jgi:hypothetical protein
MQIEDDWRRRPIRYGGGLFLGLLKFGDDGNNGGDKEEGQARKEDGSVITAGILALIVSPTDSTCVPFRLLLLPRSRFLSQKALQIQPPKLFRHCSYGVLIPPEMRRLENPGPKPTFET